MRHPAGSSPARSRRLQQQIISASLALLLTVGCGLTPSPTPLVPPPDPDPLLCEAEVYCILGLLNIFSLGLNDLADLLRANGIPTSVISGTDVQRLAIQIVAARRQSRSTRPLVLTGHSYGADDCIKIAQTLKTNGLNVDLIVLIDPSNPAPVPSNVDKCINYYLPTVFGDLLPFIFAGNPIDVEPGNTHTELINQEVSGALGGGLGNIDHFSIESSGTIHRLILLEVLKLCPQN